MLPDLNRLKVFYHIFHEQSSTGAAKILNISQSGVSQHLKKLEEELQGQLFTRVNRRLIPTTAGIKLYEIMHGFLDDLEEGIRDLGQAGGTPSGLLRIGAPSQFGKRYLAQIAASFNQLYPEVSFRLELGGPKILFEMVSTGQLDFAYIDILPIFLNIPKGLTAYTVEPLIQEEFVLACSQSYYNKHVVESDYENLSSLNYVSYSEDIALFQSWFNLHYGKLPTSLNLALVADSAQAIISAMEAGMGLGIIVSHLISDQINQGQLQQIGSPSETLKNTIACVQFKDKVETITVEKFQDFFRKSLRQISNLTIIT